MQVRVLGPVGVVGGDGGALALASPSQRLVLAVLASRLGETVSTDTLVDALWGDDPPRTATHTLRTYVSRLRALLGDAVAIRPGGYALALEPADIDSGQFEMFLSEAGAVAGAEVSAALLEQALGLWRGPAFGELAGVAALRGAAVRLEELRLAAIEARARAYLAGGQAARAAAAAEELVAGHPLREGAWAVLVEALAAAGRPTEALRAYGRAGAVLAESGLVPSTTLRQAEMAALAASGPPMPSPRALPASSSSFIGRDVDVAQLDRLLAGARMVTLFGPGGVGKTRLALAVAERISPRHRFGARLVSLAPLEDPAALAGFVVDALGLTSQDGRPETVLAQAGALDLLVVLDNCEHVVAEAARVAETILSGGGLARILATSRERLGVDGEHSWAVSPLALAGDDRPARALLLDRARAVRPDLVVRETDMAAADRIVRRLDGLPLAIEMAAARAATLPLAELADRLDDIDGLASPRRNVEPRHRTMAAVVEWSEALLDDGDAELFAELSVFAGPVEEADVAAATGRASPLPALCRLAERSLLVVDTSGTHARFGMLGTVRSHAARRLKGSGRGPALSRRHAEHFTAAAAEADRELRGAGEAAAAARLDALTDELRAAHRWARSAQPALAERLSGALYVFAQSHLRDEPLAWAAALVDDPGPGPDQPAVLASAALRRLIAGDLGQARVLAERAVAAATGDPGGQIAALDVLSDVHLFSGRLADARQVSQRVLEIAEQVGDPHAVVTGYVNLVLTSAYSGQREEAEELLERAVALSPAAPSDVGWLAYTEGEIVLDRDPERALAALERAVALGDAVGNRYLGGVARVSACSLRSRTGDPAAAFGAFISAIDHWRRQGARHHLVTTLRNLVVLLTRVGAAEEAAVLLAAVEHAGAPAPFGEETARLAAARRQLSASLGPDEARRCADAGAALDVDAAALAALDWLSRLDRHACSPVRRHPLSPTPTA